VEAKQLAKVYLEDIDIWSRAGRGVLAHNGKFWYPIQLIQYQEADKSWLVRWWRGCSFEPDSSGMVTIAPRLTSTVPELDIVDSLWGDQVGRQKIQVSTHIIKKTSGDNLRN